MANDKILLPLFFLFFFFFFFFSMYLNAKELSAMIATYIATKTRLGETFSYIYASQKSARFSCARALTFFKYCTN